ncbi:MULTISPECIES: glutamyl-tRNA reductase [Protofrankia]|uniref:Glutamyl-tRNA reductase n=1 Tax=Candidatus Protofrankia datiscae TaxID=2716812 RepID=F8AW98_9ACTN|nr:MULTISPECIES: glutamyl-tRNA reductase [Protofrankia]AEH11322.1 Glutamyl-tRNA reductase [Candidatus Protofrankia datiscae]
MSLLVVGLNHRSAPTSTLEKAAVPDDDVPKVLHDLSQAGSVAESVVLSTCNRTEIYAEVETFHGGVADVSDQLTRITGTQLADLAPHLYVHHEARAVGHLFSVVCGLDSMLVGETQILGQVRSALRVAQAEASVGATLEGLFQTALRVGKRAHSETAIGTAGASIVSVGVRLAAGEWGPLPADAPGPLPGSMPAGNAPADGALAGRRVLLVGAGAVGALAAAVVRRAGATDLVVANRTAARARRIADTYGAEVIPLTHLADELSRADLVISSTGASGLILTQGVVADALARRDGQPLVLLDLALPRDVDVAVRELPGVALIDLETLRTVLEGQQAVSDVESVRTLVASEVSAYLDRRRAHRVAPTVVALRAQAAAVVREELLRLHTRLPNLDARDWAVVEGAVRRVADKILHAPTVRVQQLAAAPGGDSYAEALRELFDLPRDAPAVVSVPDLPEAP